MIATETDLLYPLTHFCRQSGRELPAFEVISPEAMPQPARRLLVHHGDMTSRLERHYSGQTVLRVLHREHTADAYRREVVLCLASNGLPVEYGAIEINLGAFSDKLRELIVEARLPLGGLLNQFGVRYRSEPRAFLKLAPNIDMNALFEVPGASELYGRCNVLCDAEDRVLAQIVEVLRPDECSTTNHSHE